MLLSKRIHQGGQTKMPLKISATLTGGPAEVRGLAGSAE